MNLEETRQSIRESGDETLYILWTNADPVTANLMVFMYAENSMRYHKWDAITIIVWGATTKLVAEDELIQSRIRALQELGVHFTACITCAEELGVTDMIRSLDIDLIKWLNPLTELLKGNKHLITV